MVRCKSTPVWLDIIPVNWAEASERIRQQFVYIFADFNFSNDLWSLWVWILQRIRPALASRWLPSSSIVWYPVYPLILSTKSDTYTLLIWFHLHATFIIFSHAADSSPLHRLHDSKGAMIGHSPHRPADHRGATGGYALRGVRLLLGHCGGEGGELCQALLQRSQVGKPWGFSQGEVFGGIYGIEISWNIMTYYWNDRDFQPTIEILWISSFGKTCVSNHWTWSNMKALRFLKSLKQLGLKTIKCVYRVMRDMRRVLENMYIDFYQKWWIWPSIIVEMSCFFFF